MVVLPYLARASIEKLAKAGVLHPGKRPLGAGFGCRVDILVAGDHREQKRDDGKNGFGVEVWFHAQQSTTRVAHTTILRLCGVVLWMDLGRRVNAPHMNFLLALADARDVVSGLHSHERVHLYAEGLLDA
jgi:hypothetical protein